MKRKVSLLLALALAVGLVSGCTQAQAEEDGRLQVVATLFPYYDFARQIGGERVSVTLLLAPGRESHSFEPTPLDVIRISEADVFLYNGGEDETWVTQTLEAYEAPQQVTAAMMDYVNILEEEFVEGMEAGGHDHGHEADEDCDLDHNHSLHHQEEAAEDTDPSHEEHGETLHEEAHSHLDEIAYDEHIWTSPVNAKLLSAAVCEALTEADPAGAEYYAANLAAYQAQLDELDARFREVTAQAKRRTLVFGDRFPLLYFCKTYGLDYRAAFHGCSSDTEPSVRTLAYLIDKVKTEEIPVVYHLELSSAAISNVICESTGAKPLQFHTCHSLSRADFEGGATYLSLMQQNVEALKEGLL